ncbi:MAG TPA: copper homeostasis periplasmic binding protein CopC [Acetobacteraceae bacterium]|nr:copper homeostasis periplasmic binding protein CopC [Acetobacteraceae bacterium]
MRNLRSAILASAIVALPATSWAHARLRSAEPAVGGTVRTAPAQVEITFSEAVEPRFSDITVHDASGRQVDRKDVHVSASDAHRLTVGLEALQPGQYTVNWHATSVDTHKTEGSYSFTVAP